MDDQYWHLQVWLIPQFKFLADHECKLKSLPNLGYATCVREKVISSPLFRVFTKNHLFLLGRIVDENNASIHATWDQFQSTSKQKLNEADVRLREIEARCAKLKVSNEIKGQTKGIMSDY